MDAAKRKADTPREHTQSTDSSDDDRDDFVDDPKLTEAGAQRRRDKDAKRRKENCCANVAETQPAMCAHIMALPAPAPEAARKPKPGTVRPREDPAKWEMCIRRVTLPGVDGPVLSQIELLHTIHAEIEVVTRAQFDARNGALDELGRALPPKDGQRDRSKVDDWSAICANNLEAKGFRVADCSRPLVVAVLADARSGGARGGARAARSWELELKLLYVPSAAYPRLEHAHAPPMRRLARAVNVTDGRGECAHVFGIAPAPRSHQTAGSMAVCGWTTDAHGRPTSYGASYPRDEHASGEMRKHARSMAEMERTFLAPALERRVALARAHKMPPLHAWESRSDAPFTMLSLTAGFCCAPHNDHGEGGTLESILLAWPENAPLGDEENWDFAAAGVICRVAAGRGSGGDGEARPPACAAIFLPASGVARYTLPLGLEGAHRLHPGLGSAGVSKPKTLYGMGQHLRDVAGSYASQSSQ